MLWMSQEVTWSKHLSSYTKPANMIQIPTLWLTITFLLYVQWIWTSRISSTLKAILAKHVLVVADACYSGEILTRDSDSKLSTGMARQEWLRRMSQRRSRNALTSGGKEPVLDSGGGDGTHSVFGKAFIDVLTENREILDGSSLFEQIKRLVVLNAYQTPMYGPIGMTGHEGGDFFFVPKGY